MSGMEDMYREEADFVLREHMNKLKGLVDLMALGIMDDMDDAAREEFIQRIKEQTDRLFAKLEQSIRPGD